MEAKNIENGKARDYYSLTYHDRSSRRRRVKSVEKKISFLPLFSFIKHLSPWNEIDEFHRDIIITKTINNHTFRARKSFSLLTAGGGLN